MVSPPAPAQPGFPREASQAPDRRLLHRWARGPHSVVMATRATAGQAAAVDCPNQRRHVDDLVMQM